MPADSAPTAVGVSSTRVGGIQATVILLYCVCARCIVRILDHMAYRRVQMYMLDMYLRNAISRCCFVVL